MQILRYADIPSSPDGWADMGRTGAAAYLRAEQETHNRFYWLAVPPQQARRAAEIIACCEGRTVTIQSTDVDDVTVYLKDTMVNLDEPVVTHFNGKKVFL